jgi:hypothetical protein
MSWTDQHVGLAVVVDVYTNMCTSSFIGHKGAIGQMHQQPLLPISWIGKDNRRIERVLRVTLAGCLWLLTFEQGSAQQIPGAAYTCSERSYSHLF